MSYSVTEWHAINQLKDVIVENLSGWFWLKFCPSTVFRISSIESSELCYDFVKYSVSQSVSLLVSQLIS
jgi:hypothetical protein